ncbi:hypothetical protein [Pseudoalteromonas sp. M8]|uniref:hypothetical protein n=1 Tax=Pseudoalteromonas sp. M8 TaxID=2692624 RepID=UPI001BA5BFA3|nr:hypothetical protein [Pseudoalteromonas sp. M8]QUI68738.1 hypothetical protein GSF13_02715 [Pseudoalteromonas sp. M8]
MKYQFFIFMIIIMLVVSGCSGNKENDARALYVSASKYMGEIKQKDLSYSQYLELQSKAAAALDELLTKYPSTQIAFEVTSGSRKISGTSYSHISNVGDSLEKLARAENSAEDLVKLIVDVDYKDVVDLKLLTKLFLLVSDEDVKIESKIYLDKAMSIVNKSTSNHSEVSLTFSIAETLKERGLESEAHRLVRSIFDRMENDYSFFNDLNDKYLNSLLLESLEISGPYTPFEFIKSDRGGLIKGKLDFYNYVVEFYKLGQEPMMRSAYELLTENTRKSDFIFDKTEFIEISLAQVDFSQGRVKKGLDRLSSAFKVAKRKIGSEPLKNILNGNEYLREIYNTYASNGYIDQAEKIVSYSKLHNGQKIKNYSGKSFYCSKNRSQIEELKTDFRSTISLVECGYENEVLESASIFVKNNKGKINVYQLSELASLDGVVRLYENDINSELARINRTLQDNPLRERERLRVNVKMANYLEALKCSYNLINDGFYHFGTYGLALIASKKNSGYTKEELDILRKITELIIPKSDWKKFI